jgi:uncharacterized protein involved in exopolysaccharide biosynthesis
MENHSEDEISLKELIQKGKEWFQYLKTKWKIILFAGFMGGLLGLGYSIMKKPIYTATLTFALEEKTAGGAAGLSSIASSFGLNLGGGEGGAFAGDNIIELMKSRLLIEKTLLTKTRIKDIEELIINRYIFFNKLKEKWAKKPELASLTYDNIIRENYTRAQDSVLGAIHNDITKEHLVVSKIDKKLSIISVEVKSEDEVFSKIFCENLVKNVTDFYIETKVGKSRKNVQLLESRVDSVKQELDQAMYGRASFADQNMGLIRQSAAVPKLKQEMRVQMLGTMYGELVKNLEFSKLALMREEPLIQVIDQPIMPLTKERISKSKAIIIGGILFGFLIVVGLVGNKIWKQVLN